MARRIGAREADDAERKLRSLSNQGANRYCADCADNNPNHVVLSLGTFVCPVCANVHRDANRKGVRSLDTATFSMDDAYRMEDRGNDLARKRWMARWSPRDFPEPPPGNVDRIREFIWLKYDGSWASRSIVSAARPPARSDDRDRRDPPRRDDDRDRPRRDYDRSPVRPSRYDDDRNRPRDRDRDRDRDYRDDYRARDRDDRPRRSRYDDDDEDDDDDYRRRKDSKKKKSKKKGGRKSKYDSDSSEDDSDDDSEVDSDSDDDRRRSKKSSSKKKDKKKDKKKGKKKNAPPAFAGSIEDLISQNTPGAASSSMGMAGGSFGNVIQTPMGPAVMTPQGLMPPAMAAQMMQNGGMGGMGVGGMQGGMGGMGGGAMGAGMGGMQGGGAMGGMQGGMGDMGMGMGMGMGGGMGGGMGAGMGDMPQSAPLALPAPPVAASNDTPGGGPDNDVLNSLGPIQTLNISDNPPGGAMGMGNGGMGLSGMSGGMGGANMGMGMDGAMNGMANGMANGMNGGGGGAASNPFGATATADGNSKNPFDDF